MVDQSVVVTSAQQAARKDDTVEGYIVLGHEVVQLNLLQHMWTHSAQGQDGANINHQSTDRTKTMMTSKAVCMTSLHSGFIVMTNVGTYKASATRNADAHGWVQMYICSRTFHYWARPAINRTSKVSKLSKKSYHKHGQEHNSLHNMRARQRSLLVLGEYESCTQCQPYSYESTLYSSRYNIKKGP